MVCNMIHMEMLFCPGQIKCQMLIASFWCYKTAAFLSCTWFPSSFHSTWSWKTLKINKTFQSDGQIVSGFPRLLSQMLLLGGDRPRFLLIWQTHRRHHYLSIYLSFWSIGKRTLVINVYFWEIILMPWLLYKVTIYQICISSVCACLW